MKIYLLLYDFSAVEIFPDGVQAHIYATQSSRAADDMTTHRAKV